MFDLWRIDDRSQGARQHTEQACADRNQHDDNEEIAGNSECSAGFSYTAQVDRGNQRHKSYTECHTIIIELREGRHDLRDP